MPKENKSTQAEKEARLNKVYELLISGATRYQIHQYANQKTEWDVAERQIDHYIAEANTLIAQEAEFHRAREFGRGVAALNDLYQRCMKVQDYARALAVRRELNSLLGLHPDKTQTLKIEGIDDAQLKVLVDALAQRGKRASDVFAAILEEIAQNDK
jgi:hypothetical protein